MPGSGLKTVAATARRAGRRLLLESEALELVRELGLDVPRVRVLPPADRLATADIEAALAALPGDRVVVKVLSSSLAHKSERGGVAVVDRSIREVGRAIERMSDQLAGEELGGFLLAEWIEHDRSLGGELLLGMRWTDDFGPVVVVGPGGTGADLLARRLDCGRAVAVLSPQAASAASIGAALYARTAIGQAVDARRGAPPRVDRQRLVELLRRWLAAAESWLPEPLAELEVNPVVFRDGRPIALDALARLGQPPPPPAPPRPLAKLERLLAPRSIVLVGVSRRRGGPGRVILDNLLDAGYDRRRIRIVKPGGGEIAGCPCVDSVGALPEPADLAVLAVGAAQVPALVSEVVERRAAEAMIVIAGGLGEGSASESAVALLEATIRDSRSTAWGGPLVNGANCLGIRSVPGALDTIFLPRARLAYPDRPPAPLALISQSGAFIAARSSRLSDLNPRHLISIGNQIDLTHGDYLTWLAGDEQLKVFACYVEGFRPLDGRRWLAAARQIVDSGRAVILYRAGRTAAGGRAAASHTGAIAGDFTVTRELATGAGVLVADTLEEFDDLVRICCALDGRRIDGPRLGALSNAGFEAVALADGAGALELAALEPATVARLRRLLADYRLESIVSVRNPLDVTPILDDRGFAQAARLLLGDRAVDLGVIGCVPLTGALTGVDRQPAEEGADLGELLGQLWAGTEKAWVAAVDAGAKYDAFRHRLEGRGVVVFDTVDRALTRLARYARWRLDRAAEAGATVKRPPARRPSSP